MSSQNEEDFDEQLGTFRDYNAEKKCKTNGVIITFLTIQIPRLNVTQNCNGKNHMKGNILFNDYQLRSASSLEKAEYMNRQGSTCDIWGLLLLGAFCERGITLCRNLEGLKSVHTYYLLYLSLLFEFKDCYDGTVIGWP